MIWVPQWLGRVHAELAESFGYRPFTSVEARRRLGAGSARTNLALSRLARAGWLGHLAQGWYVAIPARAIQSALATGWDVRLKDQDFYPTLGVVVGRILELLGPRLTALALFGSAARGEQRPESDVDLLVVADFDSDQPLTWLESLRPVREVSEAIAFRQWEQSRTYHAVQMVPFRPEQLADPGPLFLDLTEDAILIEDGRGALDQVLARLRSRLERLGARRLRDQLGYRYWELSPSAKAGQTVEV
jgi:uncharacterized protein